MSEIERAIEWCEIYKSHFEDSAKVAVFKGRPKRFIDDDISAAKGMDTALTALRENAERERGCAYCNESKHLYHEAGPTTRMDSYMCVCDDQLEVELWQSGNSGCLAKINFCPMCGNALPSKYKPEQPKIEWDAFIEAQIQKAVENHRNNNGEDDNHGA